MGTVPTDSTLRRHYEQMQHAARLVPTDSVLRRHYGQMRQAASVEYRLESRSPSRRSPLHLQASRRPPAARRPLRNPPPPIEEADFFGWLKRLFGG